MMTGSDMEKIEDWFKSLSKRIISLLDNIDTSGMTIDQFGKICVDIGNIEKKLLKAQKGKENEKNE